MVLGICVLAFLPDSISTAAFLTPAEKAALKAERARDTAPGLVGASAATTWQLLAMMAGNIRLWGAFLCGALSSVSTHTYMTVSPGADGRAGCSKPMLCKSIASHGH